MASCTPSSSSQLPRSAASAQASIRSASPPSCGVLAPQLLDQLAGLAGVLDVALGVHAEVLGGGRVRAVAVVLHQPLQLGRADLRLGALDHVQDREVLEQGLAGGPRAHAAGAQRQRHPRPGAAHGAGEALPETDVGVLLVGVGVEFRAPWRGSFLGRRAREQCERVDGVAVLARVEVSSGPVSSPAFQRM